MLDHTKQALSEFAEYVISRAKSNLKRNKKNSSGQLEKSLDYKIKVTKNSIQLDFLGEDYLEFIDKGVSGVKKKYNTPFSYKSRGGLKGMPPSRAFDKWNIKKGRAGRDDRGRFMSRKSQNFATAVSIFYYGIKPSRFFSTPFEQGFKSLPEDLVEAYGLDVENFMELTLKNK